MMKIIRQDIEPCNVINIENVSSNSVIGGISKSSKRKCFIYRRGLNFFCVAADLSYSTTLGNWDDSAYDSIYHILSKIKGGDVEFYLFATQRELFEWLVK